MPRAKVGVQSMRVQQGDTVHILAHRLPFVAWRAHRWNERKRVQLLDKLRRDERSNTTYTVSTTFSTWLTGMVQVLDNSGSCYTAHHSDLVRV